VRVPPEFAAGLPSEISVSGVPGKLSGGAVDGGAAGIPHLSQTSSNLHAVRMDVHELELFNPEINPARYRRELGHT
jgi:hypothetical protein